MRYTMEGCQECPSCGVRALPIIKKDSIAIASVCQNCFREFDKNLKFTGILFSRPISRDGKDEH